MPGRNNNDQKKRELSKLLEITTWGNGEERKSHAQEIISAATNVAKSVPDKSLFEGLLLRTKVRLGRWLFGSELWAFDFRLWNELDAYDDNDVIEIYSDGRISYIFRCKLIENRN